MMKNVDMRGATSARTATARVAASSNEEQVRQANRTTKN